MIRKESSGGRVTASLVRPALPSITSSTNCSRSWLRLGTLSTVFLRPPLRIRNQAFSHLPRNYSGACFLAARALITCPPGRIARHSTAAREFFAAGGAAAGCTTRSKKPLANQFAIARTPSPGWRPKVMRSYTTFAEHRHSTSRQRAGKYEILSPTSWGMSASRITKSILEVFLCPQCIRLTAIVPKSETTLTWNYQRTGSSHECRERHR